MHSQALDVELNRFANVRLGSGTRARLRDAPRKRGTGCDEHPVLILLQVDSVEHAKNILASCGMAFGAGQPPRDQLGTLPSASTGTNPPYSNLKPCLRMAAFTSPPPPFDLRNFSMASASLGSVLRLRWLSQLFH